MDKNKDKHHIYAKLRELRRARGLTVDTLAKKMGENSQKVGRIERGTRSLTVDYLVKVSKALETPMNSILDTTKNHKESPSEPSRAILSDIVITVEEFASSSPKFNPQQKANMISKIYELIQNIPPEHQKAFLFSLFESLKFVVDQKKETKDT